MQSNRSIHTIEKTNSDFFNLTHESQLEQANSSHNNFMFGVPSIVSGSRTEIRQMTKEAQEEHWGTWEQINQKKTQGWDTFITEDGRRGGGHGAQEHAGGT